MKSREKLDKAIAPTVFGKRADKCVELTILGYEFPGQKTAGHDSNWLRIHFNTRHPEGNWEKIFPALLTREVAVLIDWLEAVAYRNATDAVIRFIEPNIWFKQEAQENDQTLLTITFEAECLPPWILDRPDGDLEEFPLPILFGKEDLLDVAGSLREQFAHYPKRSGW